MTMTLFGKSRHLLIWMVVAAFIFPLSAANAKRRAPHKSQVKVMTQNLYLGADIFRVVDAAFIPDPDNPTGPPIPNPDPFAVPYAVATVFNIMQQTNFCDRAEAIADEILKAKPDVIGIQEASTYYTQTPSDFLAGNPHQADTPFIDFYSVLDAALKARGLCYRAYVQENADIEMPMVDPGSENGLSDVRLVDHDMILVKQSLKSSLAVAGNYGTNLGLSISNQYIEFTRGYLAVDVKIKRTTYRFVNTHLEVRSSPDSVFRIVQDAQMQELLGTIDALTPDGLQVILVGDLNSSPDDVPGVGVHPEYGPVPYVPPYLRLTDAGYLDAWLQQKKYDEGYTSGFSETVDDPDDVLTTRIDHVFLGPGGYVVDKVKAVVVGEEVKDMTPNGLWPSDHAGVVAKIKFSHKINHCRGRKSK